MSKKDRETNRAARAAAVRKQQAAVERRRRILITLAIVVVLGAIVGAGALFSGGGGTADNGTGKVAARAEGQALVIGTDQKATKVVIYEDFLCPYCREFESATRSFLRKDAAQGKVLVEYRPFHLLQDEYSTRALSTWAAVLQHGTPTQALDYHDALYKNQPYEAASGKPGVGELVDLAKKEAGVSDSSVLDAMRKPDQEFVDAADAAASDAGVKGTPTVFVDGKELQGSSIADMASNLRDQLSK